MKKECDFMSHSLVRSVNIPNIVKLIAEQYRIDEFEALKNFYLSKTGELYADDETGLYGQSPLYVFGLYNREFSLQNSTLHS